MIFLSPLRIFNRFVASSRSMSHGQARTDGDQGTRYTECDSISIYPQFDGDATSEIWSSTTPSSISSRTGDIIFLALGQNTDMYIG